MSIYRLENSIQPYAWGSRTAIAELLGEPFPTQDPQAELWMGTHPKGPSTAVSDDFRHLLSHLIASQPREVVGNDSVQRFGPVLPYLFKVLAVARPLSIQAHPDKEQAQEGFSREEKEGVPIDASHRNYRDDNHKPEIICALTPFWALNGFRPMKEAVSLLEPVCPDVLKNALRDLEKNGFQRIRAFFGTMMTLSDQERRAASVAASTKARALSGTSSVYRWMVELGVAYPADMGVLSPALLNLICLSPGQALYLPAGQLHAYLEGVGIELMANSDNVLRGGLTPKHVDVAELLRVARFEETTVDLLTPEPAGDGESFYACPAKEFQLSVIRTTKSRPYRSSATRSVEILFCSEGDGKIATDGHTRPLLIEKGDSFLVPACLPPYRITGSNTVFKAAVPVQ